MRILGVDPGTTNAAVSVVARDAAGWHLLWSPVLHNLDEFMSWLATAPDVDCVACEDVSWQFTSGARRRGTEHGFGSADMLRAVGAAQLFAKQHRIPFVEVMPVVWRKRVSGSGKATKEQVREWVRRVVRGVPERFGLDRSDAVAIALSAGMQVSGGRRSRT